MNHNKIKDGLIILGAAGGVSRAFLDLFSEHRKSFGDIILVDKENMQTDNKNISPENLNYKYIKRDLNIDFDLFLSDLLNEFKNVKHVLDMTDMPTEYLLSVVDNHGLNYYNCASNFEALNNLSKDLAAVSRKYNKGKHVLNLGMNPGFVEHIIINAVLKHGKPDSFVEFEYDYTSPKLKIDRPYITWSKEMFLGEVADEDSGYSGLGGRYIEKKGKNAISNLESLEPFLSKIKPMKRYPKGMVVPHEEVIIMSERLEIPGKFVYAINEESFKKIANIEKEGRKDLRQEVEMINPHKEDNQLLGGDLIGVCLNYKNKSIYYYVDLLNKNIKYTSATLYLVGLGTLACFLDIINGIELEKGVHTSLSLNNENIFNYFSKYVNVVEYAE